MCTQSWALRVIFNPCCGCWHLCETEWWLSGSTLPQWNSHFLAVPYFICIKPAYRIHYALLLPCFSTSQNQPLSSNQIISNLSLPREVIVVQGCIMGYSRRPRLLHLCPRQADSVWRSWIRGSRNDKGACVEVMLHIICHLTLRLFGELLSQGWALWIVGGFYTAFSDHTVTACFAIHVFVCWLYYDWKCQAFFEL